MQLFHYSRGRYPILKTRSLVGRKPMGDLVSYDNHISFFFERPPLDILGSIFGTGHHTWFPGSVLFEHVVDTNHLGKIFYRFVETPEKTKLYYDDSIDIKTYHKELDKVIRLNNYEGTSVETLEKVCRRLEGTTRKFFPLIPTRKNYEDLKETYAGTVPHLMIYPHERSIKTTSITLVKVK